MRIVGIVLVILATGCSVPQRSERPPLSHHIDAVLGPRHNLNGGTVSLGSVGNRLRSNRLDRTPGFAGSFHFVQVPEIPKALFRLEVVEQERLVVFPPLTHQWWPSHVGMEGKAADLHLVERKFITEDDRAIDLVTLRNESNQARDLLIRLLPGLPFDENRKGKLVRGGKDYFYFLQAPGFEGPPSSQAALHRRVRLEPGEMVSFPVEIDFSGMPDREPSSRILQSHLKEYNAWFRKRIPDFECPDPWFVKLWYYRWFLVRKAHSKIPAVFHETRWLLPASDRCLPNQGEGETLEEIWRSRSWNLEEACRLFSSAANDHENNALRDEIRSNILSRDLIGGGEISVLFPYAFGVIPVGDRRFDPVFDRLFDPNQFWAPFPARREAGGKITGLYENELVLHALAKGIRKYKVPSVTRRRFFDFLQRMVQTQFEGGDFQQPRVGDLLESDTGKWTTDRRELVETSYADILIQFVGGLIPRSDEILEFHPLVDHFRSFRFRRVSYHGALLEIVWDTPDGIDLYHDGVEGYTVRRKGEILFTKPELQHIVWKK